MAIGFCDCESFMGGRRCDGVDGQQEHVVAPADVVWTLLVKELADDTKVGLADPGLRHLPHPGQPPQHGRAHAICRGAGQSTR